MSRDLHIGLYGANGHQVGGLLAETPRVRLVAVAGGVAVEHLPAGVNPGEVRQYDGLDELLSDSRVELVSLCSPRRCDQAGDARRCLRAGRAVYAEKPCALSEKDLDEIIAISLATGSAFHEMAGTAFEPPFHAARDCVRTGVLGEIVQVLAQKSYPWHDRRPQDEDVDGGLIGQNAVHAVRMVEHVTGIPLVEIDALQTGLGNPVSGGGCHLAASLMGRLANGGVATILANYLNPSGVGRWGNEELRIFGTQGMLEVTDGGTRSRLVVGERDAGPLDMSLPYVPYFRRVVESLRGGAPMPLSLEAELHPTRMVIRARERAMARDLDGASS